MPRDGPVSSTQNRKNIKPLPLGETCSRLRSCCRLSSRLRGDIAAAEKPRASARFGLSPARTLLASRSTQFWRAARRWYK